MCREITCTGNKTLRFAPGNVIRVRRRKVGRMRNKTLGFALGGGIRVRCLEIGGTENEALGFALKIVISVRRDYVLGFRFSVKSKVRVERPKHVKVTGL